MSGAAAAYRLAAGSGLAAAWRRLRPAATVFCYHNVVPDELENRIGDGALHLGAGRFGAHMDWIASAFRVVSLEEIAGRVRGGKPVHGLAAISFDDGYAGVFRHALPLLRTRNLPSTVFVVSGAARRPQPFWWDRLGLEGQLDEVTRLRCRDELTGRGEAVALAFPPRTGMAVLDVLLPASIAEITRLVGDHLTIGSHTRTHANLTRLPASELAGELAGSRADLGADLGREPDLVSYPYGCTSEAVRAAARSAGYQAGIALSYGRVSTRTDSFDVIRVNVPAGLPTPTLACWASGLRWRPPR